MTWEEASVDSRHRCATGIGRFKLLSKLANLLFGKPLATRPRKSTQASRFTTAGQVAVLNLSVGGDVVRIKKYSGVVGVSVLAVFFAVVGCASIEPSAKGARLQRMQASPQYRDGRFVNPLPVRNGINGEGHMSWNLARRWFAGNEVRVPELVLPVVPLDRADFARPVRDGLRLTWLGHSSVLIEIDGYRVLTDPVWATRVSPFSFHGSQRFSAPPVALSELPTLDAVVISHDHYDHLDRATISFLNDNTAAKFLVPLGIGARLERWGVPPMRIVELDWWQEHALGPKW